MISREIKSVRLILTAGILLTLALILSFGVLVDSSIKSKSLADIPGYTYALSPPLSSWDDYRLVKHVDESEIDFARHVNLEISNAYYHCDYLATSNLIDKVASWRSKTYKEVGFLAPNRACGLCHQAAYILARTLTLNGLNATPLGLNGHVVVLLESDGHSYILDPDFGVGPFVYEEKMWSKIANFYPKLITENDTTNQLLKEIFFTKADDAAFYSLEWLRNAELEQHRSKTFAKAVLYSVLFLVTITLLMVITIIKNRRLER